MSYDDAGWQDGAGRHLYPGLLQMEEGIRRAHTGGVDGVDTVTALKALPSANQMGQIMVLGRDVRDDGGENRYFWDSSSTAAEDTGYNVVVPNSNPATGRWVKSGAKYKDVTAIDFGVKPDYNTTNNTGTDAGPGLQAAIDYAYNNKIFKVKLPGGNIGLSTPADLKDSVDVEGASYIISGGSGDYSTTIHRMGNVSIFRAIGTSIRVASQGQIRSAGLHHMRLDGRSLTADVLDFAACKDLQLNHLFLRQADGRLVRFREVFDSRVYDCSFEFGGTTNGVTPLMDLQSNVAIPGDPSSRLYELTNQIHFYSCRFEAFAGMAFSCNGGTNEIFLTACKFESSNSAQPHLKFIDGHTVIFNGVECTAQGSNNPSGSITPGVVWFNNWDRCSGHIMVEHIGTLGSTAATPAAFMHLENSTELFDLDFITGVGASNISSATVITDNDEAWDSRNIRGSSGVPTKPLYGRRRRAVWGSGPPTQTFHGKWNVGDIIYNNAPAGGGTVGWMCTVAGQPGTWKSFGTLSA